MRGSLGLLFLCILSQLQNSSKGFKDRMEYSTLTSFDKEDVRWAFAVRNFIAHDYEVRNLTLIENVIRT